MPATAARPVATAIPDHVPPELVHHVGLAESPEFLAAPHAYMAGMHGRLPPIVYSPGGHAPAAWLVTKYEDAFFVLQHPELFGNQGSGIFPRDPDDWFAIIPQEIDPPDHRKYRAVVDPLVGPKAMNRLEGTIRALVNERIDTVIGRGGCEFARDIGRPLPVGIFLDLMGLPRAMMDEFVGWAMGLLHAQDREIAGRCMAEVSRYLRSAIAEKAASPDAGLVSAIVQGRPGGVAMSEKEVFGFVFFLFIAGLDTVFATLNNIFVWLARNPQRRHELVGGQVDMHTAVEELLRAFTVTFAGRTVRHDLELRGVRMRKGDRITAVLPACNYDPDAFPDPTTIDFNRPRKANLAFAGGVHSCMGMHLARREIRICIEEVLRRIPDFSLAEDAVIEYWPGGVVGPKTVPLRW